MQETLLKIIYFERGLLKKFKKFNLFFPWHLVPFYRQDYEKQKGPGASYQSLFVLENIFRKIVFLVICNLDSFDDLTQNDF